MLMELNDRCVDYGMKTNITKTKAKVIGRKPKNLVIMRLFQCTTFDGHAQNSSVEISLNSASINIIIIIIIIN